MLYPNFAQRVKFEAEIQNKKEAITERRVPQHESYTYILPSLE